MVKKAIFLLILLFVFPGCSNQFFPEPQETVTKFVEYWNSGDYAAMYNLLSEDAKSKHSAETFITRYENISGGIGLRSVSLSSVEADEEEEGKITFTIEFETITVPRFTQDYSLVLVKGDNQWLMEWDHNHILSGLTPDSTVRVIRHKPKRGRIIDRNGTPLVYQGEVREVGVVPGKIQNEDYLVAVLAAQLQISDGTIRKLLRQKWVQPDHFVPIKKITTAEWEEKKHVILALPGVLVNRAEGRSYDTPQSFAQTVGYLSEITAEQLATLYPSGYRTNDHLGATGLERRYEEILAGTAGFTIQIQDAAGQVREVVAAKEVVDGEDLVLTVDQGLINAANSALGRNSGSIVVLNAQSGDILALASKPGFDSNLFSLGITSEQYKSLQSLDSPFINRSLSGLFPPGSAFKPFTALMALAEGALDPDEAWDTPKQWQPEASWGGYHISRIDRPAGPVDLVKAMKWSDNVYFANLSLKVGWDRFTHHAVSLGFTEGIPFPLPVKTSSVTTAQRDTLLADSGFGQGELQVTPLHMALLYTVLARADGTIPVPRITALNEPSLWLETGFSAEQIAAVDSALKAAVQDADALAYLGEGTKQDIRGKTGTAQITSAKQVGWFACYFDSYVMVVALEGDQSMTSLHALNVAKTIITEIENLQ